MFFYDLYGLTKKQKQNPRHQRDPRDTNKTLYEATNLNTHISPIYKHHKRTIPVSEESRPII